MKNLPKLTLKENRDGELRLFLEFFNHPYHKQHRNYIVRAFPLLEELIKNSKNEEVAFKKLIDDFYLKNSEKIKHVIEECENKIKMKSSTALEALGDIMENEWHSGVEYIIMPTILPFSPFKKNIFYFSMLGQVTMGKHVDIVNTTMHEISHFIFFDYLDNIEKNLNKKLSVNTRYFLQESLTTALFNIEPLKTVLNIEKDFGNPEIRNIFVRGNDKITLWIVDYVKEKCLKSKGEKISFKDFINDLVNRFLSIEEILKQKRFLWDKYGSAILKDKELLEEYQKPIEI